MEWPKTSISFLVVFTYLILKTLEENGGVLPPAYQGDARNFGALVNNNLFVNAESRTTFLAQNYPQNMCHTSLQIHVTNYDLTTYASTTYEYLF